MLDVALLPATPTESRAHLAACATARPDSPRLHNNEEVRTWIAWRDGVAVGFLALDGDELD